MAFDGSALAMLLERQVSDTLVFEQLSAHGDAGNVEYRAQIAADEANPHSIFCCCVCAVLRALCASA